MSKKILTTLSVVALLFAVAVTANAGNDKNAPSWITAADKAAKTDVGYGESARKNASGAKITSNAHSADFADGLYFVWDSKQSDSGYLKVAASYFGENGFGYFLFTTKESNKYFDFYISPDKDAYGNVTQEAVDGYYTFFIPKVYGNKNINMVFVEEYNNGGGQEAWVPVTVEYSVDCLCDCDACEFVAEPKEFSFWVKKGYEFGSVADWDYIYEGLGIAYEDVDEFYSSLAGEEFAVFDADEFTVAVDESLALQLVTFVDCGCGCDDDGDDEPYFDEGTKLEDGDLVIDPAMVGGVLPQSNAQGWMTITINGKEISGNSDYNTAKEKIKIKSKVLAEGELVIFIKAEAPNEDFEATLELIYDGGALVGTKWL